MATVNYVCWGEGNNISQFGFGCDLRRFAGFLDRTRVSNRNHPRNRANSENCTSRMKNKVNTVAMELRTGTPLDELRELVAWLEGNEYDSIATTALRIPTRLLSLSIINLVEGDKLVPVLMQHGQSLLRNLLILVTASELILDLHREGGPPPGLLPLLLDALTLPRGGGTLTTLNVTTTWNL